MPSKYACFNVKWLLSSWISILDEDIQSRMQAAYGHNGLLKIWSYMILSFPDECRLAGSLFYSKCDYSCFA